MPCRVDVLDGGQADRHEVGAQVVEHPQRRCVALRARDEIGHRAQVHQLVTGEVGGGEVEVQVCPAFQPRARCLRKDEGVLRGRVGAPGLAEHRVVDGVLGVSPGQPRV